MPGIRLSNHIQQACWVEETALDKASASGGAKRSLLVDTSRLMQLCQHFHLNAQVVGHLFRQ